MLATLFLMLSLPAAGEPISLHPANPHYLLFRGRPTVLISSTEHYGAVLNGEFDAIPYLDELKSGGLNLTRTFSGTYFEICNEPYFGGVTLEWQATIVRCHRRDRKIAPTQALDRAEHRQ